MGENNQSTVEISTRIMVKIHLIEGKMSVAKMILERSIFHLEIHHVLGAFLPLYR